MTLPGLRGRIAWIFAEDNFDVDLIIGVSNIKLQEPAELAGVAMLRYDPDFRTEVRPGDILVGGRNFGYGHPHYGAMKAMRHLGISAVIAESFFPPYRRGETNMGFPQIACPGIVDAVARWDVLEIDWECSVVRLPGGAQRSFSPMSDRETAILKAGGYKSWLRSTLA